jgi:tRNA(fMet)-specific endonuclease VapC
MFLLDTDTLIYSMKGKDAVQKNLLLHFNDPIMLNTITLMELYYVAYKSQKVTSNLAKIKTLEQ